jgi:hypothetical protein
MKRSMILALACLLGAATTGEAQYGPYSTPVQPRTAYAPQQSAYAPAARPRPSAASRYQAKAPVQPHYRTASRPLPQRNLPYAPRVQAVSAPMTSVAQPLSQYAPAAPLGQAAPYVGQAMSPSQLPGWSDATIQGQGGMGAYAPQGPVAAPIAGPMAGPIAAPPMAGPVAGGGPIDDGADIDPGDGGYCGPGMGHHGGHGGHGGHGSGVHATAKAHWCWLRSTGDMPLHYPYFPHAHGYYYFRPYNVLHVLQQQEMVARWGQDPRNPYDNRFFERVYRDQEAAQEQDAPLTEEVVGVPPERFPR